MGQKRKHDLWNLIVLKRHEPSSGESCMLGEGWQGVKGRRARRVRRGNLAGALDKEGCESLDELLEVPCSCRCA